MEMRGIPQTGISLSAFRYKHTHVSLEGRAYKCSSMGGSRRRKYDGSKPFSAECD